MPRGRKPQEGRIQRPPKGFYHSYMGVLDAVRAGRIAPQAGHLWQIIQAHSLAEGWCGMTDAELGEHMGGMPRWQIYRWRASLRAAGLLEEVTGQQGSNQRRLVPLSGSATGRAGPRVNARQMERASIREEEEEVNRYLNPNQKEPPLPPQEDAARAADCEAAARPGAGPPGPAAGEPAGLAELADFMVEQGVFPRIAAQLAPRFLARQELADARAEVLAWWLSVSEGAGCRGRPGSGDEEQLRGRLVVRLRAAADGRLSPPLQARRRAMDVLAGREAPPGAAGPDEAEDGAGRRGPADDGAEPAEAGPEAYGPAPKAADEPLGLPTCPELTGGAAWELALAQLHAHHVWPAYSAHLAGSRCARVEVAGVRPRLVVEVGRALVAASLNHNLTVRGLAIRHLQQIVGADIDVGFEG